MKCSKSILSKRGFITDNQINKYYQMSLQELLQLLNSIIPEERTIAAKVLGKHKKISAIPQLCEAFSKEKKLYTKIAISEALGNIGIKSVPNLIKLLGKIGNNQHKNLPIKSFNKKNYPLPRDIAARTIIKIGKDALPYLEDMVLNGHAIQISEAIDAIGYISFYNNQTRSLNILKQLLNKYQTNSLITWKIIRAFQSFPDKEVIEYLLNIIKISNIPAFVWEAERSLKQINKRV